MLKHLLIIFCAVFILLFSYLWLAEGVKPRDAAQALSVVTGIGAKLGCSARYLSGFDDNTIESDLAGYSAATRWLQISEPEPGVVSASLAGLSKTQAKFRPGLGCSLAYPASGTNSVLDAVVVTRPEVDSALPWPAGSRVDTPDPQLQIVLDEILAQDNAAGLQTRALLAVKNGRVLAESYAPGIARDTPLLGWSMAKSVTAIMVGILEKQGLAEIAQRNLFPAWRDDGRAQVTLENLLQMSSGLSFEEEYVPGSDSTRMLFSSAHMAEVPMAQPLAHPPGSYFAYSSGTTNLLAKLVFDWVGGSAQSMADFLHRELVLPLALENTTFETDAGGVVIGSSYIYATARDWARFGQLLVADGVINAQQVLSPDWVRRAVQPNSSDNDRRYGYQFWLNAGGDKRWPSLPDEAFTMQGNREQVVMMLPGQGAVIVRLGWSSGDYPVDTNFARIIAEL